MTLLAALHARYDGPIPAPQRRAAAGLDAASWAAVEAAQRARLFGDLVRGTVQALARRRQRDRRDPALARLAADLAGHRAEALRWHRRA